MNCAIRYIMRTQAAKFPLYLHYSHASVPQSSVRGPLRRNPIENVAARSYIGGQLRPRYIRARIVPARAAALFRDFAGKRSRYGGPNTGIRISRPEKQGLLNAPYKNCRCRMLGRYHRGEAIFFQPYPINYYKRVKHSNFCHCKTNNH